MKVPRLEIKELQLPAYTAATATQDPSHVYDLHRSSWQHWIFNLLSKARDRIHILMDTSQVCNPPSHKGDSWKAFLYNIPLNLGILLVKDGMVVEQKILIRVQSTFLL